MFRCIATLKNDATNSLGVISSKKALRSSLLHKLRKIPKAKIAFRCIPTCRGMGRQRIGNVRSIYLPADPTFIREKEVHGKRSSFAAKKKKNAHQGNKVRPFESAREVGDRPNFRQRFGMVSWDDGEGWLGRRTYKSPGCAELGKIVCCLFYHLHARDQI